MKKVQQPDRWEVWDKIGTTFLQFTLWLSVIILSPLIVLTLCCFYIWKYGILRLVVKLCKPNLLEILNDREALYATDRFWEDSRASLAVVLILEGNVTVEKIREDFSQKVLNATSSATTTPINNGTTGPENPSQPEKLFPRLTQIPQNFGGSYFWQKANYFLLHEHIRLLENPIDEHGLKKFAGTVITLPFPNKRPLWEILVFQSYNENCSAVVIRMHEIITDPDKLLWMVSLLSDNGKLRKSWCPMPMAPTPKSAGENPSSNSFLKPVRDALQVPRFVESFLKSFFKSLSSVNANLKNCDNNAIVGWESVHSISVRKAATKHNVDSSAINLALVLGAIGSTRTTSSSSSTLPSADAKLKIRFSDAENSTNSITNIPILYPVMTDKFPRTNSDLRDVQRRWIPSTWSGFCFLKNSQEPNQTCLNRIEQISSKLHDSLEIRDEPKISRGLLRILTLSPNSLLRSVISNRFRGNTIIFHNFVSELFAPSPRKSLSFGKSASVSVSASVAPTVPTLQIHQSQSESQLSQRNFHVHEDLVGESHDLISIGGHRIIQIVPVSGLQFRHTGMAVSALRFQQKYSISITINSTLVSEPKQSLVDEVAQRLPSELDRIFEDAKDEHGFVSIPIV